jgi:hypothetical protein
MNSSSNRELKSSHRLTSCLEQSMSQDRKHWSVITQDGDVIPQAEEIDLSDEEIEASNRAFDELAKKWKQDPPPPSHSTDTGASDE